MLVGWGRCAVFPQLDSKNQRYTLLMLVLLQAVPPGGCAASQPRVCAGSDAQAQECRPARAVRSQGRPILRRRSIQRHQQQQQQQRWSACSSLGQLGGLGEAEHKGLQQRCSAGLSGV